jgi:outer membrane protein assembly factor BamB
MRLLSVASLVFGIASWAEAQVPSGPGEWPQWRGPHRDGINPETGLLKEWPAGGPRVAWQIETVGVGYSSVAIKDGRLFTQGDLDGVEHVIALGVEDGKVLWAVQPEPVARALDDYVAQEFKRIDRNGDGVVDEAEALARFGWDFNRWDRAAAEAIDPAARAKKVLAALDADHDGKLSAVEASSFRDSFVRIDAEDKGADAAILAKARAKAYLEAIDKDRDGAVSRDEARRSALERPFGDMDQQDPATKKGDGRLTAEEIEAYLLKRERGKDGFITPAELADYYAKNLPRGDGILSKAEVRAFLGGLRDGMGDGPRGTPTVDGDRVYAEGGKGDVSCLDAATGKTIWHLNLEKDLGGGRPGWGYSESPLVLGDLLIVTPGGKRGTVAALDKKTGKVLWQSEGVTEGAQYSSPVVAEIAGVRQIVQFARQNCFGITIDRGRLLWTYGAANNGTANICTPIPCGDHVFASSAYGTGGGLAKIAADGERQRAEQVYFEKKMANHHGGIVKVGDVMYGFGEGTLLCMDYLTGKIRWQDRSVRKGSLVVADGMLYLLGEGQEVALAEATPEAYREHGRFKIPSRGKPSWAHPVVVGGRFYLRDQQFLTAYDVKGR